MAKAPRIVMVKLRRKRVQSEQRRHIEEVVGGDALGVEPLFPDDDEPEFATIFEVRLPDAASVNRALECLEQDDEVEYAHEPAGRKPV